LSFENEEKITWQRDVVAIRKENSHFRRLCRKNFTFQIRQLKQELDLLLVFPFTNIRFFQKGCQAVSELGAELLLVDLDDLKAATLISNGHV
jgi:hypothetical protein